MIKMKIICIHTTNIHIIKKIIIHETKEKVFGFELMIIIGENHVLSL